MVNEIAGSKIVSKRGLSQGDPISPLLFVLAADTFARMLALAADNRILEGLSPDNFFGSLLSLQCAYDTLLFVRTNMESIRAPKHLLYGFELAFGLKINFNKSFVYHLDEGNIVHEQVAHMINCQKGFFPLTYLGIPLRPTRLFNDDWKLLINKFNRRLAG